MNQEKYYHENYKIIIRYVKILVLLKIMKTEADNTLFLTPPVYIQYTNYGFIILYALSARPRLQKKPQLKSKHKKVLKLMN